MWQTVLAFVSLPLWAFLGVLLSFWIKAKGVSWWWLSIPLAIPPSYCWAIIVRSGFFKLSVASAIFDVAVAASYFVFFVLLGEQVTLSQWMGFGFAVLGILFMSL